MKAMILAAGLGTRLRPLTLIRPKVLMPLFGTTILDFWIWQLHKQGLEAVILNAFHLHERLRDYVREGVWPIGVSVEVEDELLGTGGGIRNVLDFFGDEPFAVINGDIVCKVGLKELYEKHFDSGSPATLLLHDCPPYNNVAVGENGTILGFGLEASLLKKEDPSVKLLAFTGIHFINPTILRTVPKGIPWDILTVYRGLIRDGRPPRSIFSPDLYWKDMGSLDGYLGLHREIPLYDRDFLPPLETGFRVIIHPQARVSNGARLEGFISVGRGSEVMEGVHLKDTILWEGVRVKPMSRLNQCVAVDGVTVEGTHDNEILL